MNRFLRPQGLAALVLALGAAWLPATCNAQDIPTGAWKGTIGQASVVVCFTEYRQAQYYYLRHRRNIPLVPPQGAEPQNDTPQAIAQAWKAGEFRLEEPVPGAEEEGRVSGRWLLQATSATQITGTWTAPNNGKALPISLHRATPARSTQGAGDCDPAFYEPILAAIRLKHAPATLGSRAYQTASSDEATTLQVPADLPQAKALNQFALQWLRDQSVLAYDCSAGRGARGFAESEPLGRTLTPLLWTDDYLVLQDSLPEIFCGGAHGSSSLSYVTWSWQQGRAVDTWAWLQGGEKSLIAHTGKSGQPIASGLMRLIKQRHPRNEDGDDCREVLDHMSVKPPYPSMQGLVFSTGFFHAMRACNDEVPLTWKQLWPYLSAQGRKVAELFQR
ncbi:hypothetical protein [Acidovorax sp. RAC01]|uniref:hypothetical protein n=1 Tax=Acidovorax sp. RAC01 TaxID=1842533 RepID=UPI00083E722B|nr:hypothetical protein [Acidovorax sp. RAC01]AOG23812.1 hypothetical protein BSY15_3202 [Acidovorax sp. RAC01]